jgi:hypothetical protein
MTNATESGGVGTAVINSATCQGDAIEEHLRAALRRTEDPTARFHIREALQLRLAE